MNRRRLNRRRIFGRHSLRPRFRSDALKPLQVSLDPDVEKTDEEDQGKNQDFDEGGHAFSFRDPFFENDRNRIDEGDLDVEDDEGDRDQIISEVVVDPGMSDGHFAAFVDEFFFGSGMGGAQGFAQKKAGEDETRPHQDEYKDVRKVKNHGFQPFKGAAAISQAPACVKKNGGTNPLFRPSLIARGIISDLKLGQVLQKEQRKISIELGFDEFLNLENVVVIKSLELDGDTFGVLLFAAQDFAGEFDGFAAIGEMNGQLKAALRFDLGRIHDQKHAATADVSGSSLQSAISQGQIDWHLGIDATKDSFLDVVQDTLVHSALFCLKPFATGLAEKNLLENPS